MGRIIIIIICLGIFYVLYRGIASIVKIGEKANRTPKLENDVNELIEDVKILKLEKKSIKRRLDDLEHNYYNDEFINKVVDKVADKLLAVIDEDDEAKENIIQTSKKNNRKKK